MKIAIIGRGEYLYKTAEMLIDKGYNIPLIITSKEAPEYSITSNDYEKLAYNIGGVFIKTPKINSPEVVSKIKQMGNIDLAVSINYSGVIDQEVIDLFAGGILNAHGGDLPRYRGNACQAWAIINGENHIGLCIHKMIGGELDSGDIVVKKIYPINLNTKIGEIYNWFERDIPNLILNSVLKIHENPDILLEKQSTNPCDALRCYPRMPEDGKIDWSSSGENIVRLINASSEPYSGAYCILDNSKLVIWNAELYLDNERYLAVPGQICCLLDRGVVVSTGEGKIIILESEVDSVRGNPSLFIRSIRKRLK